MLYLIPTPIGNLEDITLRALRLMQTVSVFFCEDTRTAKGLFTKYKIDYNNKQFFSFHSYTKPHQQATYLEILGQKDCGLLSEAGTPGLSDPGKTLLFLCHEHHIPFTILPGANALVPAVVGANFPTQHFTFLGFLPLKKGRQTLFRQIIESSIPVFFYESVHRISKTLGQLQDAGFAGKVSIAREISKMYEQHFTGSLSEVLTMIEQKKLILKGEFVVGVWQDT